MKKLICSIFGHQPPIYATKGWYSPGEEYAKIKSVVVDAINTKHAVVYSECPRCGKEFKLCRLIINLDK